MSHPEKLRQHLASIDGRDYAAYQSIKGSYDFGLFRLIVQKIPKDPYAPPHTGIYRLQVGRRDSRIISAGITSVIQRIAFEDFLTRRFFEASRRISGRPRGTGYSGIITINRPGQAILQRNSVVISDETIEVRCFIGLPADGRIIRSATAATLLLGELPRIVEQSLLKASIDAAALAAHIATAEDADDLRAQLDPLGLIAFIADGAVLPRESGTSDRPMSKASVVPFAAPETLRVDVDLPHAGRIKGLGIPRGVTLIAGGGFHGKSTLLGALEVGIYTHIPGDGRERCVSHPNTVKIRAYSGRSVSKTDISGFIDNLPLGQTTHAFSTDNASGSTSQAAAIMEAMEMGAEVLLMDEDTCATNFMIRDAKMQRLVDEADEPITTFIDKVGPLYRENAISTVLVLGGIGDYFGVCDQVIRMIDYRPADVTAHAHRIAAASPAERKVEDTGRPLKVRERMPTPESIDPRNPQGRIRILATDVHRLVFGNQVIDLTDLEQLIELSQTKAVGYAIQYARMYMNGRRPLREVIDHVLADIENNGLDVISDRISGHFAGFRGFELALALNRLRGFDVV